MLTRVYRVNPDFVNPVNWRVAHANETITEVLGYSPLIFKGWKGQPQYGFENIVFMARGMVWVAPNIISEKYEGMVGVEATDRTISAEQTMSQYRRHMLAFCLLKNYMELDPHIVVKKFPTKLLQILLKRHIPITKRMMSHVVQAKGIPFGMTVEQAIQQDLSKPSVTLNPETLDLMNRVHPIDLEKLPD